jgi:PAS domain S-box-containing protein
MLDRHETAGLFESHDGLSADELRQRLHALEAIIARLPVPIAIAHDRECRFISANRALAALLGLPADANVSLTPPPGEQPLYRIQRNGTDIPVDELPMQYAITHRTSLSNEIELVRTDGAVIYVQNDIEPLYDRDGQIYGCVSVCVDVTERKLAEGEMRDSARKKDEFLATLSHELRNPLAPIRTAIEVMRLAREDQDIVENARITVERQLHHLVRITDDLLDVSRITQDKLQLRRERVDVRSAIDSAVEATRPLIDAQAQSLTVNVPDAPLWVDADFTRLVQALSNLLNNAAKYTDFAGRIRVAAAEEAGTAVVSVSDTGIGIAAEMLPRIFDMFTQLQAFGDRTHGGLGIGLSLAKRLIELHGGTLEARSGGPGQGSTFVVRIPLAPVVARGNAAAHAQRPAAQRACRILIAEDNSDTAEMMRMMFELKGHDVRVASDGAQAVDLAASFKPAIAFLDIGMPRMDGYEAARGIRMLLGQDVVLVALTGWGQDEDKVRASEAGFNQHLTKPPEPDVLDRAIAECTEKPRADER